jgi:hypothetical protein
VLVLLVIVVLAIVALIPLSLIQRVRLGGMRRMARGWVATLNLVSVALSSVIFVVAALVTSRWVPGALRYTLAGLAGGCVLGLLGVLLTRWDAAGARLYYTPNRWLALMVTLVVTGRVLYGFWQSWEAWQESVDRMAWVARSGIAESMSAGGVVLGYYLIYWIGIRQRVRVFDSPHRAVAR